MGVFAFGDLKKENNGLVGKNSLPAGITSVEIEKFLKKKGMFFCNHYKCQMQEKHCVSYQIKSIEGFKPSFTHTYRPDSKDVPRAKRLPPRILSLSHLKKIRKDAKGVDSFSHFLSFTVALVGLGSMLPDAIPASWNISMNIISIKKRR